MQRGGGKLGQIVGPPNPAVCYLGYVTETVINTFLSAKRVVDGVIDFMGSSCDSVKAFITM
jgi:hypothetical protein